MAEVGGSAGARAGSGGSSSAVETLRSIPGTSLSACSELSPDGKTLTLTFPSGTRVSFDAAAKHAVPHGGGAITYSLASLYLQIVDPDRSLLQYRQACKNYGVSDGVKATDKAAVVEYFLGGGGGGGGCGEGATADKSDDDMDIDEEDLEKEEEEDAAAMAAAASPDKKKDDDGGSRRSDGGRDRDRERAERHRREREKDKDKDKHRDRDRDRRHSSSDRHRDKDRERQHRHQRDDKERRHSSDRHKERHHKDKERHERDRDRSRDRDRDRDRHHHRGDKHDRHHQHHHHRDKRRQDADGAGDDKKSKKSKAPITNEQLMEHLDTVVGKRTQPGKKISDDGGGAGAVPGADGSAGDGTGIDAGVGGAEGSAPGPPRTEAAAEGEKRSVTPGPLPPDGGDAHEFVDDGDDEDEAVILRYLSSAGFEVTKAEIEADREATKRIVASEMPVGNSASVLRCGASAAGTGSESGSGKVGGSGPSAGAGASAGGASGSSGVRDFSRVLELYGEVVKAEERAKKGGGGATPASASTPHSSHGKRGAPHMPPPPPGSDPKRMRPGHPSAAGLGGGGVGAPAKPAGNPIIVVPNAMTSPVTMINAKQFFHDRLYVPRDVAMRQSGRKRPPVINIRRRVALRLGGTEIEYEIVDNPVTRLQRSADWDRVVAVVAQGASWQFKGWKVSNPVDIFSKAFGFYIGMEGAPIPNEVKGWNVKVGVLNRDKRGLDQVASASFWNGLDEWMSVHKPHYLPATEA